MKLALLITGNPLHSHSARRALVLARACLQRGHHINCVFFYSDGVAAAKDAQQVSAWSALAAEFEVPLELCINSVKQHKLNESALPPGFSIAGLGQWVDASLRADRVINFGP